MIIGHNQKKHVLKEYLIYIEVDVLYTLDADYDIQSSDNNEILMCQ